MKRRRTVAPTPRDGWALELGVTLVDVDPAIQKATEEGEGFDRRGPKRARRGYTQSEARVPSGPGGAGHPVTKARASASPRRTPSATPAMVLEFPGATLRHPRLPITPGHDIVELVDAVGGCPPRGSPKALQAPALHFAATGRRCTARISPAFSARSYFSTSRTHTLTPLQSASGYPAIRRGPLQVYGLHTP